MIKRIRLQPLVSLKNEFVLGYEALYRKEVWADFPSATAIVEAIFQNYDFDSHLYVNMAPNDATDPNFARDFLKTLDRMKISRKNIVLEVSESTNPEFIKLIKRNLGFLRSRGVKIALDDFGTEYSTLSFLQELPVDIVKIDRKFVQMSPFSKKARSIMKFTVQVSHDLGCKVVAEGIETTASLDCVADAGADIGQGFIFSAVEQKPSPFVSFYELLSGPIKTPLKACYCAGL
ncbi:MAG: EAL domain-containing protein [Alphaproteobacteria bacterium]|nr:EAL domain-containing protein [Alphaproteobacteria bacterium]